MIEVRIKGASTLETDLYPPIKRHLQGLGLEVKREVCGCDLVALSDGLPELAAMPSGLAFLNWWDRDAGNRAVLRRGARCTGLVPKTSWPVSGA